LAIIKTIKFPGDIEAREIYDEHARNLINECIKTVNGITPDVDGNVEIVPDWEAGLTGYATEEYVEGALANYLPDWNAENRTTRVDKGAIANRTHYTEEMFKIVIDGDLQEGTTKILDLSKTEYKGFAQYLSLEYQQDKYRTYVINGGYQYLVSTNVINLPLSVGRAIENTKNYECVLNGGFKLYVIIDRNTLSDGLKEKFDTNGIYTYTANKRENSTIWAANLVYELRKVVKKLDFNFMPAQFLETAEATELYYNKTEVDEKVEIATDDDSIDLLMELEVLSPLAASDETIYTNSEGKIYIL
jgi:hypothetical protein